MLCRGARSSCLGYPAGLDFLLMRVDPGLLATLVDPEVVEITDETVDVPALLEGLVSIEADPSIPDMGPPGRQAAPPARS